MSLAALASRNHARVLAPKAENPGPNFAPQGHHTTLGMTNLPTRLMVLTQHRTKL